MYGAAIPQNGRQAERRPVYRPNENTAPPPHDDAFDSNPSQQPRQTGTRTPARFPLANDAHLRLSVDHPYTNPSYTMDRPNSLGASSSSHGGKGNGAQVEYGNQSRRSIFGRRNQQQSSVGVVSSIEEPRFNLEKYRVWVRRQKKKAKDNTWVRFGRGFDIWYQQWIIERLLRQYVASPMSQKRHIRGKPISHALSPSLSYV
jgi:hypothetical protein